MRALLLLALVPVVLWLIQSALLRISGRPLRLQISASDLPRKLKRINRLATNVAFAAVLFGFPYLRGQTPIEYYGAFFPLDARAYALPHGAAAAVLFLALLYLAWTISDNVRFEIRHGSGRVVRHLLGVPLTAAFAALIEELLFRAVLLADLLNSFDVAIAVPAGVVVFAAAHYVRSVKRYWTFPGHLALGALFCLAFVHTRGLWLPIGLHAGGVLVLMTVRPFIRYTGPAWLVGASIFPYAGVVGIAALICLTIHIWLHFGVTP
jgi:membrane protease YdiL (CAAX protease family)